MGAGNGLPSTSSQRVADIISDLCMGQCGALVMARLFSFQTVSDKKAFYQSRASWESVVFDANAICRYLGVLCIGRRMECTSGGLEIGGRIAINQLPKYLR
jgi:hypothetical protein